jgi:hypothetical protein
MPRRGVREAIRWQEKYEQLTTLAPIFGAISKVVSKVKKTTKKKKTTQKRKSK